MDTRPLTHEELLTLARKVQAAAHDNDPHRLAYARVRLARALTSHLEAEQDALKRVPEPQREVLASGQRRLEHLLSELAIRPEPDRNHSHIADDLLHALGLQAADEHRYMRTEVATKTGPLEGVRHAPDKQRDRRSVVGACEVPHN